MTLITRGLLTLAIVAPTAVEASDLERGKTLAAQWCRSCHLTAPDQVGSLDAAPTFTKIAETAAERADDLRAWLADPHPPMPNFDLTIREIDDLLAYIQSLSDQ